MTREEAIKILDPKKLAEMADAKPILFNTDMVRAILDGRKTVTRRVVKKPYYIDEDVLLPESGLCMHFGTNETHGMPYADSLCRPGDILYVRETWYPNVWRFMYKADYSEKEKFFMNGIEVTIPWRPSIHMPREAARIFLRATDVRVEQLQDIDDDGVVAEGLNIGDPFDELWDSTIKPADRALYGWTANPWVWVIAFERCEKPEEA